MTHADDLYVPMRTHYLDQPREVSFETLALCNAACVFCPYPTLTRKGTELPTTVIYRLIDQMATWQKPFFVSPFKVNEPLLDPRLNEICYDIESHCPEATLRLFTNGQPLTERHLAWIAGLRHLDCLWISLNSTDAQEYGERMKCSYTMIQNKLDLLHSWMKDGRFSHPVTVSRVMTGHSVQDYLFMGERGSVIGDTADVKFRTDVRKRWPLFNSFLIKQDSWIGYVEPSDPRVPQTACARWFELNITATGKAVLCCMDGEEKYVVGDCVQQSLLEIYNQPVLRDRRLHALTREGIDPCQGCSY